MAAYINKKCAIDIKKFEAMESKLANEVHNRVGLNAIKDKTKRKSGEICLIVNCYFTSPEGTIVGGIKKHRYTVTRVRRSEATKKYIRFSC